MTDLFVEVGLGNRVPELLARKLIAGIEGAASVSEGPRTPLIIRGTEGMVVDYAGCCCPIPGDPIVGILRTGRGLLVHRETCQDLLRRGQGHTDWIPMHWVSDPGGLFPVSIRVQVQDRPGVLAVVADRIAENRANIEHIAFETDDPGTTTLRIRLTVGDRAHLARIMTSLRKSKVVFKIVRACG